MKCPKCTDGWVVRETDKAEGISSDVCLNCGWRGYHDLPAIAEISTDTDRFKKVRKIRCAECDCKIETTAHNAKYCRKCREAKKRERQRDYWSMRRVAA